MLDHRLVRYRQHVHILNTIRPQQGNPVFCSCDQRRDLGGIKRLWVFAEGDSCRCGMHLPRQSHAFPQQRLMCCVHAIKKAQGINFFSHNYPYNETSQKLFTVYITPASTLASIRNSPF